MDTKNKLRNRLIRQIQHLSADKLNEVNKLINKPGNHLKSKEETLKLAGSWEDLSDELFNEFTALLHEIRAKDRNIQL